MNKFVKGAKNLAFALSFVTIAACGGVKKADLETLEKSFNEKIGGKADKDSCVSKNELASLKSEIGNEVGEKIKNGVEGLKKETVNLDVLDKAFVKNPTNFIEFFGTDVKLSKDVLKGSKIVLSDFGANGVCSFEVKSGDGKEIIKKATAAALVEKNLEVLKACVDGGAVVEWGNDMCFASETTSGVKFHTSGVFNLENSGDLGSLVVLLEIGLLAKQSFKSLKLDSWNIATTGVCGKKLKTGTKDLNKKLVNVLNRYEEECCSFDESNGQVTFVSGKGWTSNGTGKIEADVKVAVS